MSDIRILDIKQTDMGEFYFTVSEGGCVVLSSDLYTDREECISVGMDALQQIHERSPLRTVDNPRHISYASPRCRDVND